MFSILNLVGLLKECWLVNGERLAFSGPCSLECLLAPCLLGIC